MKEPTLKKLKDLVEAQTLDRQNLIDDVMGNIVTPEKESPELDKAIFEFLCRIDDAVLEMIVSDINPIVMNATEANMAHRVPIICDGKQSLHPLKNMDNDTTAHFVSLVFIGGGFMERSHLGRVGTVAHEIARVMLQHHEVESHEWNRGGTDTEDEADALAKTWGFEAEIDEMRR